MCGWLTHSSIIPHYVKAKRGRTKRTWRRVCVFVSSCNLYSSMINPINSMMMMLIRAAAHQLHSRNQRINNLTQIRTEQIIHAIQQRVPIIVLEKKLCIHMCVGRPNSTTTYYCRWVAPEHAGTLDQWVFACAWTCTCTCDPSGWYKKYVYVSQSPGVVCVCVCALYMVNCVCGN